MLFSRVSARHVLLGRVISASHLKLCPLFLTPGRCKISTTTKDLDSLFNELISDPARGLPIGLSEKMKDISIEKKWKWLSDYEVCIEQRNNEFDSIVNDPKKLLSDETKEELHQLPVQYKWGIINLEKKRIEKIKEEEDNQITIHCYEKDGTVKTMKGDIGVQSLFSALTEGGVNIPHWAACNADVGMSDLQLEDYGDGPQCPYCSVHIAEEWIDKLHPQEWKELDVLWYTPDYRRNTRLSCQIPLTKELDGIVVSVVEEHEKGGESLEPTNISEFGGVDILDQLWESPRQMRELEANQARDSAKAKANVEEERFRRILDTINQTMKQTMLSKSVGK